MTAWPPGGGGIVSGAFGWCAGGVEGHVRVGGRNVRERGEGGETDLSSFSLDWRT